MLEQIVKKYVPFKGIYNSDGFDENGRITIPKNLIDTLQERQDTEEKGKLVLFYRLHTNEVPRYLELTDYFTKNEYVNFSRYKLISQLDKSSRILITPNDLNKIIEAHTPIVFVGSKNKILIYTAEDYKSIEPLSFDALWNIGVRLLESYSLPKLN